MGTSTSGSFAKYKYKKDPSSVLQFVQFFWQLVVYCVAVIAASVQNYDFSFANEAHQHRALLQRGLFKLDFFAKKPSPFSSLLIVTAV